MTTDGTNPKVGKMIVIIKLGLFDMWIHEE